MRRNFSSLVCLTGTLAFGSANADTIYFQQGLDNAYVTNYQGTSDTSLNSASNGPNPGYNNGNMGGSDYVSSNQTRTWEEMRTLFRFDLSSLTGQGLNVDAATLILRPLANGSPDNLPVSLHSVSSANAGWQRRRGSMTRRPQIQTTTTFPFLWFSPGSTPLRTMPGW